MNDHEPADAAQQRTHTDGLYSQEEVQLANRNSGILLETLRHDVTPAGLHYLLNHFDVPYVADAETWTLSISGKVKAALTLRLADIRALPARTLRVTLECAGNGRARMAPRWQSQPWIDGAVGTADWTGTPLRYVLERAGLAENCIDIAFLGADRGFDKVEHDYGRSLTKAMALSDDVLLVTAMNGQPLLPQHGFPLRLVVPGWYGMASVKWLHRIEALATPFQGHQQVGTYIYKSGKDDPGTPVTTIRVKSLMVPPGIPDWYSRHRVVEQGSVDIMGRAWSGAGVAIAKVEFAADGVWQTAELDAAPTSRYAWRGWRARWQASPGRHTLMCRATDVSGAAQPLDARWDSGGFGNNMAHRVDVTVR